jgi:uncharacterized membrane protein YdjX (TVP38/TMEM64 family)
MAAETFVQGLLPVELRYPRLRALGAGLAMLTPVFVFSWLAHAQASGLARWVDLLHHSPHAALYVELGYALGCLGFVPISVLLAATVVVFDPWHAFVYALSGALIGATLAHRIGRHWQEATLRELRGRHGRHLQRGLRVRAFRATLLARLLPAGNFTAGNLLAGALNLAFWPFFLGNVAGLSFGIAGLLLFAQLLAQTFSQPSLSHIASAALCGLALNGVGYALAHWFMAPAKARRSSMRLETAPHA